MSNENNDTAEGRLAAAGVERLDAARVVSQAEYELRIATENHQRAVERYKSAVDRYNTLESDIARGVNRRPPTPEKKA